MSEFRISGLPVVKEDKLVGIITNRDIRFQIDGNMEVSACMTSENLITVPLDTSLEDAEELLRVALHQVNAPSEQFERLALT